MEDREPHDKDATHPRVVNLQTPSEIDWLKNSRDRSEMDRRDDQRQAARAAMLSERGEGEIVDTPDGTGVISAVFVEPRTYAGVEVDASPDSPRYVVALVNANEGDGQGFGVYAPGDLSDGEIDTGDADPGAIDEAAQAMAARLPDDPDDPFAALSVYDFDIPESWDKSPKPNRAILLQAWANMGGTFRGARSHFGGSARLAAALKDRVMLTEDWR